MFSTGDGSMTSKTLKMCSAVLLSAGLAAAMLPTGGCAAGLLIGGMADSYQRQATHNVKAKYTGLRGESIAVVVSADQSVQADHPGMIQVLSLNIARRLKDNAGPSAWALPEDVLRYQATNPAWTARTMGQLADDIGVDRIVFIELTEFRLHEPGNPYIWDGYASGRVAVIEADGPYPDDFVFEEFVSVAFPDQKNLGPMQVPEDTVLIALAQRFVDRSSWLFYDHEEKVRPDY